MLNKITLENEFVRLEPLEPRHASGLWKASAPEIWTYMPVSVTEESNIDEFIGYADQVHQDSKGLAFAVVDPQSNEVVGSTGFWNYEPMHSRIEIGFTWYTPARQRTAVNTSCKRLLLAHAFEVLNLNRVEFKTDSLNERSRRAIARLGAIEEGILRAHMVQPDGRLRDSVYFSILRTEWPQTRQRLDDMLNREN